MKPILSCPFVFIRISVTRTAVDRLDSVVHYSNGLPPDPSSSVDGDSNEWKIAATSAGVVDDLWEWRQFVGYGTWPPSPAARHHDGPAGGPVIAATRGFTLGVRPNSPIETTIVLVSSPRLARSSSSEL